MTVKPIARTASALLPDREALLDWTSRISWGRAAGRLEDVPYDTLILLPLHELVTIGSRSVQSRVNWHAGSVLAVRTGEATAMTWSHTERSHEDANQHATITLTHNGDVVIEGSWPQPDPPAVAGSVRALVDAGHAAEWELLTALEPFVHHQLECVSRGIAAELGACSEIDLFTDSSLTLSVIDGLTIDALTAGMLYGEADGATSVPAVTQLLIHRYADGEDCALRVPLVTYLHRNIAAQATGRIRTAIGDSMLGPRIRRVAAGLPRNVPAETVLERCRALGISGREPLGIQRVRDALAVPLQVAARSSCLSFGDISTIERHLAVDDAESPFERVDEVELVRAYRRHSGIDDPDLLWLSWEFEVEGRVPIDRDQFWLAARRLQLAEQ